MTLLLFAAGSTGQTGALAGNQGPTQSSPPEKPQGIVAARNASGKDLTQALADEKRHYYALLFATNDYDNWPRLVNPIADARSTAEVLRNVYGFQTEISENSAFGLIKKKLRSYVDKDYGYEDELFIFFAGHGDWDEYDATGYLIPRDGTKDREARAYQIAIPILANWVNQIKCRHILLVLDAVQAGPIFQRYRGDADQKQSEQYELEMVKKRMVFKTRKCISSGGREFVEDSQAGHHSPFAAALLAALGAFGSNRKILNLSFIEAEMERHLADQKVTAEFGGIADDEPGSDFFFIVSDEGSASAKPR